MPDKPRTYRAPDELYDKAADLATTRDLAKPRAEREGLGGFIRLALRAYLADPDAADAACRRIAGNHD